MRYTYPTDGLIAATKFGLHCPRGGFYIDPWCPVEQAIITHAHSDHVHRGSARYLTTPATQVLLQRLMDPGAPIQTANYGEVLYHNGVRVSLHPAGHILGSAQVRVESRGEVWVVSGDSKSAPDPTCDGFEPIPGHTVITDSTFALPIYCWEDPRTVFASLNAWWNQNLAAGRTSIVYTCPLGMAQRLLRGIEATIGPIYCHAAVETVNEAYRVSGITLPTTQKTEPNLKAEEAKGALVIAPASAQRSPWRLSFGEASEAFASGKMAVRRNRPRRKLDRSFVISDHADWPGLVSLIEATGAQTIVACHGPTELLVRSCQRRGLSAYAVYSEFRGEIEELSYKGVPKKGAV